MKKAQVSEPQLSVAAFSQRCKTLAVQFGSAVGLRSGEVAFAPEISSTVAVMTLGGRASEMISRNRGSSHRVVPLASIQEDILIWTGYRESWQKLGSEQNFRFVEAGFTLHVGRQGELSKPQIMRSEWVGRRSRAFVELAGHPHWQLDVLETARAKEPSTPARFTDVESASPVKEFGDMPTPANGSNLLLGLTVENMHLASSAQWWRLSGSDAAHVPETVSDLDRWILACTVYLRQEASRCRVIPA
ncbi:hypothetical protein [Sinorhizobium mexicanum]|uniref:Uncharacterized protein n=1 Tax=Sinorhizobium mexicanum TaxID=375549 RepID=A0A859QLQ8_9HYPH|nr:hypothetical protein [Sinorhizobium mexicanum]MBP1884982.1 hypothetical protein [Sinorhizobium mexicanum]QLL64265.1 hypothetical protein FKV68_22720 [Sinorhizobium mexicanum]